MRSKVLHEIIDVLHGRGLIDAARQAELKALASREADGEAVTVAEDGPKPAAGNGGTVAASVSPPPKTPPARVSSVPETA